MDFNIERCKHAKSRQLYWDCKILTIKKETMGESTGKKASCAGCTLQSTKVVTP